MYATAVVEGKVVRFKLSPALARAHRQNRSKTMTEAEAVAFVEAMDQVEQEFGKANPNAPAALSRFAFLIGRWRCEARVRLANGEWQTLQATWLGRFILDGYAIADEIQDDRLLWRADRARHQSPDV